MSQPRYGSSAAPGRRESNIAIGGLGAAAVGGVGARAAYGRLQGQNAAVRSAAGRLGQRVEARDAARDKLRTAYRAKESTLRDLNLLRQTGAPGAPGSKKAMREAMAPYNRSVGAFKAPARKAGAAVRDAQKGLQAAKKARLKGRVGLAAMGALTAGGVATAAGGAFGAERARGKASRKARRDEARAMGNVIQMQQYRVPGQKADRAAEMRALRPKRPAEGSRKFREDPNTGKWSEEQSARVKAWEDAWRQQIGEQS